MNRRIRGLLAPIDGGDRVLLLCMGVLVFVGIFVVYGAGSYNNPGGGSVLGQHFLISKHLFMIGIGLVTLLILANLNYHNLRRRWLNWSALALGLVLVALTLKQGEAGVINRWVTVGGFRFQPVELTKVAVILFIAERWTYSSQMGKLSWKAVLPGLFIGPIPLFYILYKQPNFGNILTMAIVVLVILLVAGFSWKRMLLAVSILASGGVIAFISSSKLEKRLEEWWNGVQGGSFGYQVDQSLMGMGAGGPLGLGPGNGHNKFAFLPEAHTDFIYSVMGEELGVWGTLAVLCLLVGFLWRGYSIASRSTEPFGRMVAAGLTTSLAVYGLANIAMVTGAFPVVGVPLPFVSFGGTAMVAALASVGILLNIDHTSKMMTVSLQRARDRSRM